LGYSLLEPKAKAMLLHNAKAILLRNAKATEDKKTMMQLPKDLDEAVAQAKISTAAALKDGKTRIMVELVFPELKQMAIAWDFLPVLTSLYGSGLKVFFPDTGAAALARRDWKLAEFTIADLGNSRTPLAPKIQPEDEAFLIIEPSAVEVLIVEELCQLAGDRPCILFNPKLEDVSIVGIGYAARQLRDRFISTLESYYYLRPMEDFALMRAYPDQWQVWQLVEEEYRMIAESAEKPVGEVLDQIMMGGSRSGEGDLQEGTKTPVKTPGLMANLQRFLRALSS